MNNLNKKMPVLFEQKKECCGCGACVNICSRNAITMCEDAYGFLYPQIDESLCITCGRCKSVCAFQNQKEMNTPIRTYAAISKNREQAKKSASGGIFAAIASEILSQGGVVFGAAFDEMWQVRHIGIENIEDLYKLQGSKYVHSSTNATYQQVKQYLKAGKKVLYSGTPCQIAGLYGYLGDRHENLLTIDIICHGVPSNRMFRDYLNSMERQEGGKVTNFTFRDKNIGWGKNGLAEISTESGKKYKTIWESASAYLYCFSRGWLFRENCYNCKYTCSHRPGDLTLGDYWGIEKVHADYLGSSGWNEAAGISVIVANTERGCNYLNGIKSFIEMKLSDFEKASAGNPQLRRPNQPGARNEILKAYLEQGWEGLEKQYRKKVGLKRYVSFVKALIPAPVKRILKKHM